MKKSSKIAIIILVIIVTFSLGTVGGYLLFKGKYNSSKNDTQVNDTNKNNNINNNNESKDNNTDNTPKEETLSLDDKTVTNLWGRKTNFHTTNKVTYSTLSDQRKLSADLNGLVRKSFSNL